MIRFIKEWVSRKRANPSSKAESASADETATDDQSTDADTSTSSEPIVKPTIPAADEVEIQRRFNEFERRFNERQQELLNDRAKSINSWLAVIAIVLTAFGIVIPLGAYIWAIFSFKEFEEIKTQAQSYVKEIEQYRDEAESLTQDINAEIVADNPTKAKQIIEDVRKNPKASSTDKAIAKAVSLQDQGKREEALKIWRGIADAFEKVDRELAAEAWFSVGYLLKEQGKPKEAIAAYDQAIHLKSDLAIAHNNRGNAKSDLGRYEAAIADYNQAIQLKSDYAEAYYNRGTAKDELGQHEDAFTDYDQAIHLKPDLAEAYNNRGNTKGDLGRHEAAITDYDEAIRLKPDFVEAYFNRGNTKGDLGRHEAAITDYDEAIRLKPDFVEAYFNRGNTKNKLGRMDEARRDFEKVRDLARKAGNDGLVALAEQRLRELDSQEGE